MVNREIGIPENLPIIFLHFRDEISKNANFTVILRKKSMNFFRKNARKDNRKWKKRNIRVLTKPPEALRRLISNPILTRRR